MSILMIDIDNGRITQLFQCRWLHGVENRQAIDRCQCAINNAAAPCQFQSMFNLELFRRFTRTSYLYNGCL